MRARVARARAAGRLCCMDSSSSSSGSDEEGEMVEVSDYNVPETAFLKAVAKLKEEELVLGGFHKRK